MFPPLLPTQNPRGNAVRAPHYRPRAFGSGLLSVNVLAMSIAFAGPATAQGNGAASLAQAAQDPIADMISLPFQYSINLDYGPLYKPQHILNTQPFSALLSRRQPDAAAAFRQLRLPQRRRALPLVFPSCHRGLGG